jgi:hypothetical protein
MNKCQHCGFIHDGVCPRIKSIEYYENGMLKKVEYHAPYEPIQDYNEYTEEDALLPF